MYGVDQIFFERANKNVFEIVGSATPNTDRSFQYLDDKPIQGYNYHRARIVFDNGEEVVTDLAENFFLTETPFAVFPNPVEPGGDLNIFGSQSQTSNSVFRLFGTDGRQRLSQELVSDREVVNLTAVHTGLYFYTIESNLGVQTGKILVVEK